MDAKQSWRPSKTPSKYSLVPLIASNVYRYKHCTSIRFWKSDIQDMGVYAVKQYLETGTKVEFLELLDNGITYRGCEHIAKALHPKNPTDIQVLKLDHN